MDAVYIAKPTCKPTCFQSVQIDLEEAYPSLANKNDFNWQEIVNLATVISIPADTQLLQPDTPCMQFMLLLKGSVRVYQQTPNDREATLYRIHGGDLCVLSINGLMQNKDFGAFAKTETEISALIFSRELFLQALEICASFREFILLNLTSRFVDVLGLMEEVFFENLDTRLICLIARLSREYDSDILKITHAALARELGTSREVVSRLLKSLEKQGCITLGRGEIRVLV